MNAQINYEDMEYLHVFPGDRKAAVMQKIMSHEPGKSVVLDGDEGYEEAVKNLHHHGYGLIDLHPHETAFTAIWYRKGKAMFERASEEVAMLLWEAQENGNSTTVMTWQV